MPVLISYAATEFGGGVAGWNLADHEAYWKEKRGSVGRAHAGCELRVVDQETGEPLGVDEEGLLEVKAGQIDGGAAWTHTTDLARIDADGFLWILGRADQAIIRGGFKVLPDTVRGALESDPRVLGAAVVGRDDERLGSVPVAAVELRPASGPVVGRRPPRRRVEGPGPLRAARRAEGGRLPAPDRLGQGRPHRRARTLHRGALMDLTYSDEDEAFRAEVRAWLEVEVPAHGPPPPPGDWPARRAYDTGVAAQAASTRATPG